MLPQARQASNTAELAVPNLPPPLAEVSLIDAPTCAAVGQMGVSWWYGEVRAGRAPAPAIRQPRCTRWRLSEVREFWRARGSASQEVGE